MYFFKQAIMSILLLTTTTCYPMQSALLVSLGMPDNVLKSYFKQGQQYKVPIYIRGLYKDPLAPKYLGSFSATAHRLMKLTNKTKQEGVSIDPLLFRAFNLKAVPALVIYDCTPGSCSSSEYDIIRGNIGIPRGLQIISDKSKNIDRVMFAKKLLKGGS